MHFNGTAVMDRSDTHEQSPPSPSASVAGLSYGELAIALCASDMPTVRHLALDVSDHQLVAWVCQGSDRLGEDRVRELDEEARGTRIHWMEGRLSAPECHAVERRIWGSVRRSELSHGMAYRILCGRGVL
jgi:hypothetical protein